MVVHAYNPSPHKAEAEGQSVQLSNQLSLSFKKRSIYNLQTIHTNIYRILFIINKYWKQDI